MSQAAITCITEELSEVLSDAALSSDRYHQRLTSCIRDLKPLLSPQGGGDLAIAQINVAPGDLKGNALKMMRYAQVAESLAVDMVVFPELALMGYPVFDLIRRHPFLVDENIKWLRALAKQSGKTRMAVGFVEPRTVSQTSGECGKWFYNSVAILAEGCIEGVIRKSLLPNYSEFHDVRTYEPADVSGFQSPESGLFELGKSSSKAEVGLPVHVHGKKYGVSICEDIWNDADFFEQRLYDTDPVAELARHQPDVLLNLSASPSRSRKEQMKHNMLCAVAKKYETPLVYVNQVGAIDEISYDGASRVYDKTGQLIARAKSFEEQFFIVNPITGLGTVYPLVAGLEKTLQAEKIFDAYDTSDLARTYAVLVQGIRDYFAKVGFQRTVLGLSGGLDSSVVVTLLVDALGAENVLGVSMPSELTSDESKMDAEALAKNLGIQLLEVPIVRPVDAFESQLAEVSSELNTRWGVPDANSFARDNVQAISRATLLRMIGNDYRAFPVATSDKSEFYLGYTTVNGDMSGALAPLGDVPKTKVRLLAAWLNTKGNRMTAHAKPNALPQAVIEKPSGAELAIDPKTGKTLTAEDALMPYAFCDEIIWRIETLQQSKSEILESAFQWEQEYALSREQKQVWVDRFFRRMASSVFKWWIAPPMILVEGNGSIAKTDYRHPITASRVVWEGTTAEDIEACLAVPAVVE